MMRRDLSRRREAVALLLITLLAAALRFYRLPELPPGLHYDEGFKGVTARGLLTGEPLRLFFESDMGEEPVAIYLVAAALGLFGQSPWIIRLVSAVIGTLTVPLAWWLGRELGQMANPAGGVGPAVRPGREQFEARMVGLGTALVLAILYWHVSFSRIGMEPILVPLCVTLAFAALLRGLNRGGYGKPLYGWFVLTGLAVGGSLYTYKAGYFVPILSLLFLLYAAVAERRFLRRHGSGLLLAGLVALLVAAPLILYFVTHPASFWQRPASVALSGGEATWENLPRVLGMFFVRGDANPRSNLPGRPALDPFLAFLFLAGVVRALRRCRHPRLALPLLWLGVMTLPTLVTEHAPHFGRAIGATPAVALLCGLGMERLLKVGLRPASPGGHRPPGSANLYLPILAAGLAFATFSTARAYFQTWGRSPDLFYAYDVGLVEIAARVNRIPADEQVYLTPTSRDHYTLQFLLRRPLASFDGRAGLVFPPPGRAATVIVLPGEDEGTLPALQQTRPDGTAIWTVADGYHRPYAVAYHLPASDSPAPSPDHPAGAIFGRAVRLLGYALDVTSARPGDTVKLTLYWQALAPLDRDYTVFTHLLGDPNPATGSPLWAGHDSQPDNGHYPTSAWQPGEVILDVHPLLIPAAAPPGEYRLEAGLYLLETMVRLPATDAAGRPLPDHAALLGELEIGD